MQQDRRFSISFGQPHIREPGLPQNLVQPNHSKPSGRMAHHEAQHKNPRRGQCCDERGTETYNLALGQRRADVTRDYLIAEGVAPARISTISYGKERPVSPGHNEDAWVQNRNAITSALGFNPQAR